MKKQEYKIKITGEVNENGFFGMENQMSNVSTNILMNVITGLVITYAASVNDKNPKKVTEADFLEGVQDLLEVFNEVNRSGYKCPKYERTEMGEK